MESHVISSLISSLSVTKREPWEYLANRYGFEFGTFVAHKDAYSLTQIKDSVLRRRVERQLKKVDPGWIIDYEEECFHGPQSKIEELDARLLNLKVCQLLCEIDETNKERIVEVWDDIDNREKDTYQLRYLDRITHELGSIITIRFLPSSKFSVWSMKDQKWRQVLIRDIKELTIKVAFRIMSGGIASDEVTTKELSQVAWNVVDDGMQFLGSSSYEELKEGGSDRYQHWLMKMEFA